MANLIKMMARFTLEIQHLRWRRKIRPKRPLLSGFMLAAITLVVGVCLFGLYFAYADGPNIFTEDVGIGTSSPSGPLHVGVGTTAPQALFVHSTTGKVGIGTTSPTAGLTIGTGTVDHSSGTPADDLYVTGNLEVDGSTYLGDAAGDSLVIYGTLTAGILEYSGNLIPDTDNSYDIGDASTPLRWKDAHFAGTGTFGGNVGIGTTSPGQLLSVAGNIELTTGGHIIGDSWNAYIGLSTAGGSSLVWGNSSFHAASNLLRFYINGT
ncbi:unnamed protein product, partial [marine sediment metagenome]